MLTLPLRKITAVTSIYGEVKHISSIVPSAVWATQFQLGKKKRFCCIFYFHDANRHRFLLQFILGRYIVAWLVVIVLPNGCYEILENHRRLLPLVMVVITFQGVSKVSVGRGMHHLPVKPSPIFSKNTCTRFPKGNYKFHGCDLWKLYKIADKRSRRKGRLCWLVCRASQQQQKNKTKPKKQRQNFVKTVYRRHGEVCAKRHCFLHIAICLQKATIWKHGSNYLQFGFSVAGTDAEPFPQCVVGADVLANDSLKPFKLKCHLKTNTFKKNT